MSFNSWRNQGSVFFRHISWPLSVHEKLRYDDTKTKEWIFYLIPFAYLYQPPLLRHWDKPDHKSISLRPSGECRKNQVINRQHKWPRYSKIFEDFVFRKASCGDIIRLNAYKIGATRFPRGWRNAWSLWRVSGVAVAFWIIRGRVQAGRSRSRT